MSKEPITDGFWISEYEADQMRRRRIVERRRIASWLMLLTFTAMICLAAVAFLVQR